MKQIEQLGLKGEIHMIGDGYTDYEVKLAGVANRFYAYTENITRENVTLHADHIAPSFDEILYQNKMSGALSYPKTESKCSFWRMFTRMHLRSCVKMVLPWKVILPVWMKTNFAKN